MSSSPVNINQFGNETFFQSDLNVRSYLYRCLKVPFVWISLFYVIYYGFFLYFSDFLPYVMDNNESFSAITHAYNLYYGDYSKHFGLTDEAFSPFPEAHPMIHTHQGNFPRIFSFLLFTLGARSIEAQIGITTFSIGFIAIGLVYKYFSRITNKMFASIVCVIFMTDYILFTQWQVNTYRVWHVFFIFSSLLCIHNFQKAHNKKWFILTILNYAGLFYGELVFAVYLSLWSALYTICIYRQDIFRIIKVGLSMFLGGLLGVGILFGQLIGFWGIDNAVQDFKITLFARNTANVPLGILKAQLTQFYDQFNVIFFYNIIDGSKLKTLHNFLLSFFEFGYQIHTPILGTMVISAFLAWIYLSCLSPLFRNKPFYSRSLPDNRMVTFVIISFSFFLYTVVSSNNLLGLSHSEKLSGLFALFPIVTILGSFAVFKIIAVFKKDLSNSVITLGDVVAVSIFLLLVTGIIHIQSSFYNQKYSYVWFDNLSADFSKNFWRIVFLSFVLILCFFIVLGDKILGEDLKKKYLQLNFFIICGLLAFGIVYVLSPGYVYTGYLTRYTPFHVFLLDTMVAVMVYLMLRFLLKMAQLMYIKRESFKILLKMVRFLPESMISKTFNAPLTIGTMFFISIATLGVVGFHWGFVQHQYFRMFPPTVFNFVKMLRSPEFKGKSSVSNAYSVPFAYQTNFWSFLDLHVGTLNWAADNKNELSISDHEYVWFADRKTNQEYKRPDYFICFFPPAFRNLRLKSGTFAAKTDLCSQVSLVNQALKSKNENFTLIKSDESGDDRWAIIRFKWD